MGGLPGRRFLGTLANLGLRAALAYFSIEALAVAASNPGDRRFSGKGIAIRNALILSGFSAMLPVMHCRNRRSEEYPWVADALLLSVPVLDMAGNSFDLYNQHRSFDVLAHFYGTAVVSGLAALALAGSNRQPRLIRWLAAVGGTTFFHVLLEVQEYWTDVIWGTHNVEGLEDTEGDLLAGILGAVSGLALSELVLANRANHLAMAEARRLAATLEPLFPDRS